MIYHALALALSSPDSSMRWPADWSSHGPRHLNYTRCAETLQAAQAPQPPPPPPPPPLAPPNTSSPRLFTSSTPCLEEMFIRGTRLTFSWVDMYADESRQLEPLTALATRSVGTPHIVLAGIGAWFAYNADHGSLSLGEAKARYASAAQRLTADVDAAILTRHFDDSYFGHLATHVPKRVWLSIPACAAHSPRVPQAASPIPKFRWGVGHVVHQLNGAARAALQHTDTRAWRYLDREALTIQPCEEAHCRLGTFHPTGAPLDVTVLQLLRLLAS